MKKQSLELQLQHHIFLDNGNQDKDKQGVPATTSDSSFHSHIISLAIGKHRGHMWHEQSEDQHVTRTVLQTTWCHSLLPLRLLDPAGVIHEAPGVPGSRSLEPSCTLVVVFKAEPWELRVQNISYFGIVLVLEGVKLDTLVHLTNLNNSGKQQQLRHKVNNEQTCKAQP